MVARTKRPKDSAGGERCILGNASFKSNGVEWELHGEHRVCGGVRGCWLGFCGLAFAGWLLRAGPTHGLALAGWPYAGSPRCMRMRAPWRRNLAFAGWPYAGSPRCMRMRAPWRRNLAQELGVHKHFLLTRTDPGASWGNHSTAHAAPTQAPPAACACAHLGAGTWRRNLESTNISSNTH